MSSYTGTTTLEMQQQTQNWSPGLQSPMSPPPTYDVLLRSPTLQRQWNIQPREDEGREELPGYSSAISLENVFMKKMELEGAINRASDRGWYRVIVKLQGTALTLYKCKRKGGILSMFDVDTHPLDSTEAWKKGKFLRSYNLTHADVGIASDYTKKSYVLRLRAEEDQFLLSCHSIETFVLWLQSLFAAIDLAPPLDERSIPRDLSIPRRRRTRIASGFSSSTPTNPDLLREQQRILQQYPHLGDASPAPLPTTYLRSRSNNPASLLPTSVLARARSSFCLSSLNNPNLTSDGKWRPQHQWTHFYDMLYAKRCMAVLTHRSPRKSNLVIVKGKQWIIDWATGRLTSPPSERIEMSGAVGGAGWTGGSGVRPPSYAEFEGGIRVVRGTIVGGRSSMMGTVRESVNMGDGFLSRASGVAI